MLGLDAFRAAHKLREAPTEFSWSCCPMQISNLAARLRRRLFEFAPPLNSGRCAVLIVVEGAHDVVFLKSLSRTLHAAEEALPDLGLWEQAGRLVFLPFGGGQALAWAARLAAIGLPELHIYDREMSPETELRRQAAELINRRPRCRAFVTQKRSLENYLHPDCIRQITGLDLVYGDDEDVAELAARACYARFGQAPDWGLLPRGARKRFRERAKKWLNRLAVELMTPELLAERDSENEIRSWLSAASELMQRTS
jgi:hypothetical protein